MATKIDSEKILYIFQWKIENASHSLLLKEGEEIFSPIFIADELEGTEWKLGLHFVKYDGANEIDIILHQNLNCCGSYSVSVEHKLEFMCKDGSTFRDDIWRNDSGITGKDTLFFHERENFLPDDTLTIQYSIWKADNKVGKEGLVKSIHLYARTVLKVTRKSFDCCIENFSSLQPGVIKEFPSDFIEFRLVSFNKDYAKELKRYIISDSESIKYISCNTWIIDSKGKKENRKIDRYFSGAIKKEMSSVLSFASEFKENKNHYFPNDVLSLCFDIVLLAVEHSECRTYFPRKALHQEDENIAALIEDFKSMYYDSSSSDIKLCISGETLLAHKTVLIARSPVFRKMLSHDMKEKESGEIKVEDMDADTVQRMLLFMYTGSLEDMTFINASKLYQAADKYNIASLRSSCSAFMEDVLCPSTVFEVLLLGENHKDDHLKNVAFDYILQHEQVFRSLEWENFVVTNFKLAVLIMKMKVNPDKI